MALVRELLAKAVRHTADFDPGLQVRPACILWPDGERQWEAAIPALQKDIPELLVLGAYNPKSRTGPAIWLRCAIELAQTGLLAQPDDVPYLLHARPLPCHSPLLPAVAVAAEAEERTKQRETRRMGGEEGADPEPTR